jgi:hypothetical protein
MPTTDSDVRGPDHLFGQLVQDWHRELGQALAPAAHAHGFKHFGAKVIEAPRQTELNPFALLQRLKDAQ